MLALKRLPEKHTLTKLAAQTNKRTQILIQTGRGKKDSTRPAARPDLSTHGAVDDEVERVAENDDHVDEERGDLVRPVVDDVDLETVLDDEQDQEDGERQLDDEERADDGHQHQRRPVALRQPPRLAPPGRNTTRQSYAADFVPAPPPPS